MNKAQKVIEIMDAKMNELAGDPVSSLDQLKSGDNVTFGKDDPNAGLLGIVIGPTPGETGKVDLKVGRQTSVGIEFNRLLKLPTPGSGVGAPTGKGNSGSPVAPNGAQVGAPQSAGAASGDAGRFGKNGSPLPFSN